MTSFSGQYENSSAKIIFYAPFYILKKEKIEQTTYIFH